MEGLLQAWTRGFESTHAGVKITLRRDTKLSAEAFDALLAGDVQIAPMARELFPEERARYTEKFHAAPRLVEVAGGSHSTKGGTHAIAVYVNNANPLVRLSLAQVREIFSADGRIATWGQLGLTGDWVARPIHLYGMLRRRSTGNPPGVVNYLEQGPLRIGTWRTTLREQTDSAGGQALALIVRRVAEDEAGIGYSGFGYATPGAKTLALGRGEAGPFFAGSPDEVARRDYPLSRPIYLCVSHAPSEATREFLRYALSAEGQKIVTATREKFLPLPWARARAAEAVVNAR
jgi:phosphate transport system substrate-binding protein